MEKDKYHMILFISGTYQQNKQAKQNITRGIKIKNKLIVTRRDVGEDNVGDSGKGHQGTCIKDRWTMPKGVGLGWEVGMVGFGG